MNSVPLCMVDFIKRTLFGKLVVSAPQYTLNSQCFQGMYIIYLFFLFIISSVYKNPLHVGLFLAQIY